MGSSPPKRPSARSADPTVPDEPESRFPRQGSARRRLLQTIVALSGWGLFVYWWWLVFQRVSRKEIVFTAIFIAVSASIAIVVTALWSLHNKRLHRRKGPRTKIRPVREDYSRDTLLRTVSFPGGADSVKRDPVVRVHVGEKEKVYRA